MFLDYWSIDSGSRAGSVSLLTLHVFLAVPLALDARGKLELAKFQLCASMETLE